MLHMAKLLIVALILFSVQQIAFSQRPSCTSSESAQAEKQADTLRSWDALYRSYRQFAHCDDGAIAEGYSESVARILVDHWDTLPRLAALSKRNRGFQRFVVRHVDATLNTDDLNHIRTNATHRCPAAQRDLCKQLQVVADAQ